MNKFSVLNTVLMLITALLFTACSEQTQSPITNNAEKISAQITTVALQKIDETYSTSGTLIADNRIDIASRMTGYIRQLNVDEGDLVKNGQLLLTIDPTEIRAQLAEAKARLSQSKARLREAKADQERYRTLFKQKMIAVTRLRSSELNYQLASEESIAAQATLDRIAVQLDYAKIKSPVNGIVVKRHKQRGDIATPGTPLLTIENPENIVVRSFIKEQHIGHVQVGSLANISIDAINTNVTAQISSIIPSGDPATHSYQVKLTLKDTTNIRTGMFARVDFNMGQRSGILIPASAIIRRSDMNGIYIVDADEIAHYRLIRTGKLFGENIEVLSGLRRGDRIIISSTRPIHTGIKISEPTSKPIK